MVGGTLNGVFIILSFYIFFVILWKIIRIATLVKSTFKEGSILESLKGFSKEEFEFLCKKILEREGFGNFTTWNKDFLVCERNGKNYGILLNNNIQFITEQNIKFLYGYSILNNLQGIIIVSIFDLDEKIKERVEKFMNMEFISYGIETFNNIYEGHLGNSI
jgi:hypothetical protein